MNARFILAALAGLVVLSGASFAQDDDLYFDEMDELDELLGGDLFGDETASGFLKDWRGFVELRPRSYFGDRGGENENAELILESEFEFNLRLSDDVSGYFRPRVYVDGVNEDTYRFEPFEAYVTLERDNWDLRLGQFVENWGIVDTYNPLDVLNRRDLGTDPLDAQRLGEFGLRFRKTFDGSGTFGEPTLSLYALPFFRRTRFGDDASRLGPGTTSVPFDEDGGFEPNEGDEAFFAARYQSTWNADWANSDVQLMAARGPSRSPALVASGGGSVPAYFGANTFGAGIRAVPNEDAAGDFLAALTLKAEVVFTNAYAIDDSPITDPDDFLAFVVGVDRAWYGVVGGDGDVTLTVEYAGESGDDTAALLRPFRDDMIGRVMYEVNDFARQSLEVRGLFDMDVDEQIFEVVYERQLRSVNEDLKLIVSAQIFETADAGESFYGSLDDLSSISVALRLDL